MKCREVKQTNDEKLRSIRALYTIVYNAETPLQPIAVELFHLIGEILEGTPPGELDMHRIDKRTFLKELAPD